MQTWINKDSHACHNYPPFCFSKDSRFLSFLNVLAHISFFYRDLAVLTRYTWTLGTHLTFPRIPWVPYISGKSFYGSKAKTTNWLPRFYNFWIFDQTLEGIRFKLAVILLYTLVGLLWHHIPPFNSQGFSNAYLKQCFWMSAYMGSHNTVIGNHNSIKLWVHLVDI